MWTLFWDMHSGGSTKEKPYEKIYIEAAKEQATIIFYNRFGHNPNRITCTCCGEDYAIYEDQTLELASNFHRKKPSTHFDSEERISLEEYAKSKDVLIIQAKDILPNEYIGKVPKQGYVWIDYE